MKDFTVVLNGIKKTYHLPTSIKEIPTDYFENVTKSIIPAENYSLIAIIYHESLASIILAQKQNRKDASIGVTPIFVKSGNTTDKFITNISVGDKLIIASSDLTLSHHVVSSANKLSLDKFIVDIKKDNFIAQRYNNNYGLEECYFVEFKLVPNCSIHGSYSSIIKNKTDYDYTSIEKNN